VTGIGVSNLVVGFVAGYLAAYIVSAVIVLLAWPGVAQRLSAWMRRQDRGSEGQ
jgi:hypothetical protein